MQDSYTFDKTALVSALKKMSKRDGVPISALKSPAKDIKTSQSELADEMRKLVFKDGKPKERKASPTYYTVQMVAQKALNEAYSGPLANSAPNAFRLALGSLVIDECHAAFSVNRNGVEARVELLYPNANKKITIKISVPGSDFMLYELALEDDAYRYNFGLTVVRLIDMAVSNASQKSNVMYDNPLAQGNQGGGVPSTDPMDTDPNLAASQMNNVGSASSQAGFESIFRRDVALMQAFLEADATTPPEEDPAMDPAGGVGSFGEDDFAMSDPNGADPMAGGVGGAGGMPAATGIGAAGGVNAGMPDQAGSIGIDDGDDESENFKDYAIENFTTEPNGQFSVLANIVSDALSKQMQSSTQGVQLNPHQIMFGMTGINNRPANEIIDAFLKLYPDLDDEFKIKDLEVIGQKLEENPSADQFNQFLQGQLKIMKGDELNYDEIMRLPGETPNAGANTMGTAGAIDPSAGNALGTGATGEFGAPVAGDMGASGLPTPDQELEAQANAEGNFDTLPPVDEFANV
jgi:hypothetical protein